MQRESWKAPVGIKKITFYTYGHLAAPCRITLTHSLMGANQGERWVALVAHSHELVLWPIDRQQIAVVWVLWGCTRWIADGWSCGSQRNIRNAGWLQEAICGISNIPVIPEHGGAPVWLRFGCF